MKRILLFADAHVAPNLNLDRFTALGNMIVAEKPDAVGCLGDLATCDSVSFWDVKARQRPTLREDVEATHQALRLMFAPLIVFNNNARANHKRRYMPHTFVTMGNHEQRIDRRLQQDQFGFGSLTSAQRVLKYGLYFDKVIPYKEYYDYAGMLFTHAPINANNAPFSGHYRGRHIGLQARKHIVYGHTHKVDLTTCYFIGNDNAALMTLNLPAFMDQDHVQEYAKDTPTGWSYGVVMLNVDEDNNTFGFEWLTTQQLMNKYFKEENG